MNHRFPMLCCLTVMYAWILTDVIGQELSEPDSFLDNDPAAESSAAGRVIEIMALDTESDNVRSVASIPEYPVIYSPEVSSDGAWVAVDGWKHGQRLTDAHLLLVHRRTGIVADLGPGAMPSWPPDGRRRAWSRYPTADNKGGVFIGRVDQSRQKHIHDGGWAITWAPVGQKVVYIKGGDLIVVDFKSKSGHTIFADGESPYRHILHNPEWSPDGSRICFIGLRSDGTREFATVAASGDADLQVCCSATGFNPDIGWSKDGRRLTIPGGGGAHGKHGQIWVYDFETKGSPTLLPGQSTDRHNSGNDWSPDGKTLYFVSSRS
jgi:TolB protein